jgi:hypothetical protein
MKILLCFFGSLLAVLAITYFGRSLRKKHPSDIRAVWFFFSLSLVVSVAIAWWASAAGYIDSKGSFHGEVGAALDKTLKVMLDLNTDFTILVFILALITIPQLLSYLLSGLFGTATSPLFIEGAIAFFIWSIVKSFATVAGIAVTMSVAGLLAGWRGVDVLGAAVLMMMATLFIMVSFTLLQCYRDIAGIFVDLGKLSNAAASAPFVRIHRWLTRYVAPPVDPIFIAKLKSVADDFAAKLDSTVSDESQACGEQKTVLVRLRSIVEHAESKGLAWVVAETRAFVFEVGLLQDCKSAAVQEFIENWLAIVGRESLAPRTKFKTDLGK